MFKLKQLWRRITCDHTPSRTTGYRGMNGTPSKGAFCTKNCGKTW